MHACDQAHDREWYMVVDGTRSYSTKSIPSEVYDLQCSVSYFSPHSKKRLTILIHERLLVQALFDPGR